MMWPFGILATEHSAHAIVDGQFHESLDHVANRRVHATTRRVVAEHFAEEQSHLQALPNGPFQAVLRVERRITRDGMISVDGNLYSVPNATRRRVVEVHSAACEIRILEDGRLIAVYPVLEGAAGAASRQGIAACRRRPTAIRRVSRAAQARSWRNVPLRSMTLSRAALLAWEPGHDG